MAIDKKRSRCVLSFDIILSNEEDPIGGTFSHPIVTFARITEGSDIVEIHEGTHKLAEYNAKTKTWKGIMFWAEANDEYYEALLKRKLFPLREAAKTIGMFREGEE